MCCPLLLPLLPPSSPPIYAHRPSLPFTLFSPFFFPLPFFFTRQTRFSSLVLSFPPLWRPVARLCRVAGLLTDAKACLFVLSFFLCSRLFSLYTTGRDETTEKKGRSAKGEACPFRLNEQRIRIKQSIKRLTVERLMRTPQETEHVIDHKYIHTHTQSVLYRIMRTSHPVSGMPRRKLRK